LHALLERAEGEARAVLLTGRAGKFSAGFDLSVMTESDEAMRSLVSGGAELLCTMYEHPLPIVSASTGHALAMGALLLLASDIRVGADGPFKIGLTEVAIGMPLPVFVIELARDRLERSELVRATLGAKVYDPAGAVGAGYLDRVVPAETLQEVALEEAKLLASYRSGAFARSKRLSRAEVVARIRATTAADLATLSGPTPS
jgi:enoyl-CoA hydratase